MEKDIAHIVYASDDRFAEILGVSLVSLYENSRDMRDIVVYVLESGISEDNQRKLDYLSNKYKRHSIVWIKAKNITEELQMEVNTDRGNLSQYARLFISSILPPDLDRVLYLDCDVIIRKSIRELWNVNICGNIIGALMDAFSKYYRKNIDLEPKDLMFNSGVMLIDLKEWKEKHIEDKLICFIKKKHGLIQQGDQGALNAVLCHNTYCIEPRFNSVTIFYDFTYKEMLLYRDPPYFYPEIEVKKAIEDPSIVHFTTSIFSKRAWMKECNHRYVGEWLCYKTMSPWKDTPLWDDTRPKWKRLAGRFLKLLPRNITIRVARIAQVYLRPMKYRFFSAI